MAEQRQQTDEQEVSVQTKEELAGTLHDLNVLLIAFRTMTKVAANDIRARVPSCGNPPIHPTGEPE